MEDHRKFMKQAISLSADNLKTLAGGPFGCVIVRDGEILSAAANTVTQDSDPTAHAEINAIRQAAKKIGKPDLSGCTLYTSAEPCPMCLSAIYWCNIKQVFYGNTKRDAEWAGFGDQFILDQLQHGIDEQAIKFERLSASEAIAVFEKWVATNPEIKSKVKDGSR
ncbi:nucleoside deaminase [Sphingobacterium griseoflavum]|uniref:tRNA-specific adenosine deaminase n=1 Tax=Sphingobacterium griseoflavum TaxID=1474952 RepID=A0ABQ3I1F2_9SPHI|nr:nucleoside deaminase [Sphingobacterium griseoflavum]GHE44505.1 tRNA-specific adenosine deaminase [Sphingobacterium griseoflavum]